MATKGAEKEFEALCARLGGDAPEGLRALSAAALKDLNSRLYSPFNRSATRRDGAESLKLSPARYAARCSSAFTIRSSSSKAETLDEIAKNGSPRFTLGWGSS